MQEIIRDKSDHVIQQFRGESDDFRVVLSRGANVKFCGVVDNSNISITFDVCEENTLAECYFFIQGKNNQKISLRLQTNFFASNAKMLLYVIALSADNAKISLDGNIHIDSGIDSIETRLYEESLLLGNSQYISMIPGLKVESPDVIASHGAKVQRISPENLFYMQSRGLSEEKAVQMLVNSYSEFIVEKMDLTEREKEKFYSLLA